MTTQVRVQLITVVKTKQSLVAILAFMTLIAVADDQNGCNGPNGYDNVNGHNGL